MPINQERIQKLREYGLTDYQSRVYLALLDLGVATASQMPALSRVPRTRIYATMQQLHAKGLVQILPEKPLRYKAVPFAAYLQTVVKDYRNRAKRLDANLDSIAREFPVAASEALPTHGRFEAIYGRRNVRERLAGMYEEADQEIVAVGSDHSPGRILRSLGGQIADRARDGVTVRYAFHLAPHNHEDVRGLAKYADVRTIDFYVPVCRHGVDGREFLMSHPIPDDDSASRGEDIAIWTDDTAISAAMAQMAKLLWEMGKPLTSAREEEKEPPLTTA